MPLVNKAPYIRQLEAAVATLKLVDWVDRTGIAGLHVRHTRHRFPTTSEKPCVSVGWAGTDDASPDGAAVTEWERQKLNHLLIAVDMRLETEDSESDVTGWGDAALVAAAAYEALNDPASPLRQLCDWVSRGDDNPDEDSKPDDGRLVSGLDVVYRVRTDDPNVLLAPGENAT